MLHLYIITFLSLLSALLCILKYFYKYQLFKKRGDAFEDEPFIFHRLFKQFLFEFLTLCIHPSPFLKDITYTMYNDEFRSNMTYLYNDLLVTFVVVRLLFHTFEVFQKSRYNTTRIQRINFIFNNEALSVFLPLKNYIASHPVKFMFSSFICSVLFFSALIIMAERPLSAITNQNLDEWAEVIWYVVVTMATIGYGDRMAKTLVARFIVIILVIWGNFWSSIFLSSIFPYIQQSLKEDKAHNHYNRFELRKEISDKSAKVVSLMIQLNFLISKKSTKSKKIDKLRKRIVRLLKEIKKTKKEMNMVIRETNFFLDDVLSRVENVTNITEDHLNKGEKIYKNVSQTLKLFAKKIKGSIIKVASQKQRLTHLNITNMTQNLKRGYGSRFKNLQTMESKDYDHEYNFSPRNKKLNQLEEEELKDHKKIYTDIKKKLSRKEDGGLNFAEDLHKYLADYLDSSQNRMNSNHSNF